MNRASSNINFWHWISRSPGIYYWQNIKLITAKRNFHRTIWKLVNILCFFIIPRSLQIIQDRVIMNSFLKYLLCPRYFPFSFFIKLMFCVVLWIFLENNFYETNRFMCNRCSILLELKSSNFLITVYEILR